MATDRDPHEVQQADRAITRFLREHSLETRYRNDPSFHTAIETIRRMLRCMAMAARMHVYVTGVTGQTIVDMLVSTLELMRPQVERHEAEVLGLLGLPAPASAPILASDPRLAALQRLCKGAKCHAKIFWAHTGRTMTPVDYEPVEVAAGTIRLVWPDEADPHTVVFPMADTVADQTMRETLYPAERWYRPHWSTCPDAPGFRHHPKARS